MRLADFIVDNRAPILREWEAFARTCKPASGTMNVETLRDHADQMLTVIAEDLRTPQGKVAQAEKSKGQATEPQSDANTPAEEHGAGRLESGFSVEQMVAEFRALRASVLRLWTKKKGELLPVDVEDLTRFNEAIDQSLAESVTRFTLDLEQSKESFIAILGHDLRTPLAAISTSAQFMLQLNELTEPYLTLTSGIARSAARTIEMVGTLLDFTRSRLGGIPVELAEIDMGRVVHNLVDEVQSAHPDRTIEVDARGELRGYWDQDRISQALSNLIANAVQHGAEGTTITVEVHADDKDVVISVHNYGLAISPEQRDGIFNPMHNRPELREAWGKGPTGSLGLGLYIAERIVTAHRGHIEIESSEASGTTFTVHLPRGEKASA